MAQGQNKTLVFVTQVATNCCTYDIVKSKVPNKGRFVSI